MTCKPSFFSLKRSPHNFTLTLFPNHSNLDGVRSEIDFNITAPILLIRAFLPLIRKGSSKKILIITSTLGSISNAIHLPGLGNAYSIAKAGLNM